MRKGILNICIIIMIIFCSCGKQDNSEVDVAVFIEQKEDAESLVDGLDCHPEWVKAETEDTIEFLNSQNRKETIDEVLQKIGIVNYTLGTVDWVWDGEDFLSVFSYIEVEGHDILKMIVSFDGVEWTVEKVTEGENENAKRYYSTNDEDDIYDFVTGELVYTLKDEGVRSEYPGDFLKIYDTYAQLVQDNVKDIVVNDLVSPAEEEDNYISYSISFERKNVDEYFDAGKRPEISIGYYDGKMSSFTLSFDLDEGVEIMKQLVIITVSVMEDISYVEAEELTKTFFDNYNGQEAVVLKLDKYKYVMNENTLNDEFGFNKTDLEVVDLDRLAGADEDRSEYVELTAKDMQAVFNEGMKGYVTAQVLYNDISGNFIHELSVTKDGNEYLLYYDPSVFTGEFVEGNSYTFYGTVAEYDYGYDGFMRIDFYDNTYENVVDETEILTGSHSLKYISGCNTYTIMENMKSDYYIENPDPRETNSGYVFSALDGYYQYEIYTYENLTDVYMVDFSINNNGKDLVTFMQDALEYLLYVATVPYDTSDSTVVKEWIKENVAGLETGTSFEIVVGDAKFTLYGDWYIGVVYLDVSLEPFPDFDTNEVIYSSGAIDNIYQESDLDATSEQSNQLTSDYTTPSFSGSTCLDIDYNTGMPVSNVTEFEGTDNVFIAGCLQGVSGENTLTIQWVFPDGYVEETKQYYIKNGETICVGFEANYIGNGSGSVSVILDSTGNVLATYYYTIVNAPIYSSEY